MGTDHRPRLDSEPSVEPLVLTRAQVRRLRIAWMALGAGISLGTAGAVLRNPWLLSGLVVSIVVILILNHANLGD